LTKVELDTLRYTINSYGFSPQESLEIIERIDSLSPKRRRIVLLALGGMNQREIGERLGMPQQTISDNILSVIGKNAFPLHIPY
jgi:DNA-directed RNA polymerase specialized sigma24 family protein